MRVLNNAAAKDDLELLGRIVCGDLGPLTQHDLDEGLLCAANNGNFIGVSMLLAHGADTNCEDSDGDTALMLAAINGHVDIVQLIITHGCDINVASYRGRNALHMAVWNNQESVVDLLLAAHCDMDIQDYFGETALMLSAKRGYHKIMEKLLISGCDMYIASNEQDTALHYAAKYGYVECVRVLLEINFSIECYNMWSLTPLVTASMFGQEDCCLMLLKCRANPNAFSKQTRRTVLHNAADNNLIRCTKTLLLKNVHLDQVDVDGNSAIMYAVKKANHAIVLMLLQHGCCVDFLGRAVMGNSYVWCSPLEAACHHGNLVIAKMLYYCSSSVSFLHCSQDCDVLRMRPEMFQWIQEAKCAVRSLSVWCSISIRNALGKGAVLKVRQLRLPKLLQHKVALHDIALIAEE